MKISLKKNNGIESVLQQLIELFKSSTENQQKITNNNKKNRTNESNFGTQLSEMDLAIPKLIFF